MRAILCILVAGAVLLLPLLNPATAAPAEDAWEASHRTAQVKNPPGVTLTLRAANGKAQWRQGEIIPIELAFAFTPPERYSLDLPYPGMGRDFGQETFSADPPDGVADPMRDFREFGGGYSGPGPEITSTLKFDLNEWLRFDKPGKYRIYVLSSRVEDRSPQKPSEIFSFRQATSNIIQLEILPLDRAWAAEQLRTAVNILDNEHPGSPEIRQGARIVRFLGTPEAARAIIRHLDDENSYAQRDLRRGLLGFMDRAWLVREMERTLPATDYAISRNFLRTLADLAFAQTHPRPAPAWMRTGVKPTKAQDAQWQAEYKRQEATRHALLLEYWRRAADALAEKTGSARTKTLASLLDMVWGNPQFAQLPAVRVRLPQLTQQIMAFFDELPIEKQKHLLGFRWRQVREFITRDALLPILRRTVTSTEPVPAPPQGSGAEWNRRELIGLALRGIYELSPDQGRRLILQEIQNPQHRTGIKFLTILPNQTLPELDDALATNIEKQSGSLENQNTHWLLVERYATPAIAGRVKTVMGDTLGWSCASQGAALAYLLRAAPADGAQTVEKALAERKTTGCYRSLFSNVAKLHITPELEKIAIAHLNDPDAEVMADAARALGQYGSAAAAAPLWQRLRQLHEIPLETGEAQKTGWTRGARSDIETALATALGQGRAWLADKAKLEQLRNLCRTPYARQAVESWLQSWRSKIRIEYSPAPSVGENDRWTVAQYRGDSLGALKDKLSQFPPGTAFVWRAYDYGAPGLPEQARRVLAELRTFLQAHSMTISPQEK